MRSLVVAYDRERGIGVRGDLPWNRDLPSDLRHFRALTIGRSVIMGRNTFESIGILPKRENIVVTSRPINADVLAVHSLAEAYRRAQRDPVVIGGASVYAQAIKDVDVIYATEVDAVFPDTDTFFPELDDAWRETVRDRRHASGRDKYDFAFVTYERQVPR